VRSVLSGRSSGVFPAVAAPKPETPAPGPPAADAEAAAEPFAATSAPAPRNADPTLVPVHVGESLEDVERRLLQRTLEAVGGNKKKAAELLKISLKTVYNKVKQYALEP